MFGGLSHHADEGNGPSHTVGHELSKQQGCYSLERNQCVCADVIRVPANYKNKPAPLDMTDVVRDDVIRVPANYKNKPAPLDMTDVVRDVDKHHDLPYGECVP